MIFAILAACTLTLAYGDDCNLRDTDMWYGDIYQFQSGNFQACKDRCRGIGHCVAVVYFDNGKCWLKKSGHWARGYCGHCTAALKSCIIKEGPCPAGQYKTSATSCGTCGANTYSGAGSWSCSSCTDGSYSSAGASGCLNCPAGTYRSSAEAECTPCPVNTYAPNQGHAACDACPAGTASPVGAVECANCTAGTYRSDEAECTVCPENTYGEYTAATNVSDCTPCPEHYISPNGSAHVEACQVTNGDHCWPKETGFRLTGVYGEPQSIAEAKEACFADEGCVGFSCHKNKANSCQLATGNDYKNAKKYNTYVNECFA